MPRLVLICLTLLSFVLGAVAQAETRQLVQLPKMMQNHMLANMRDHLLALTEIQRHLAQEEYEQAAQVAENRLGMSSLHSHGADHMAAFMPKEMQQIGTQMHQAASRFALVVQEGGMDGSGPRIAGGLADVMQQCAACHSAFRVHP